MTATYHRPRSQAIPSQALDADPEIPPPSAWPIAQGRVVVLVPPP